MAVDISRTLPPTGRLSARNSANFTTAVPAVLTDFILALGLVLSTSSQLRFPDLPIGAGELCFLIWLFIVFIGALKRGQVLRTGAFIRLLAFWSLFGLSLWIGFIVATVIWDRNDSELIAHDAIAYTLLAAMSLFCVLGPDARTRMHRVAWLAALLGAVSFALQLMQAWELFAIPNLDPWFWERMRGWSENPNQLAFMCSAVTWLSVQLIDQSSGLIKRLLAAIWAIIAIVAGRLTQSDSFGLALISGLSMFATVKIWGWIRSCEQQLTIRAGLAWSAMLFCSALLSACLALSPLIADQAREMAQSFAKNGGREVAAEADLRFSLWREAISRGFESGLLGLGPGPHLEIPDSMLALRKTEKEQSVLHPDDNGSANYEAHNTYLDLFTQGGAVAVLSFLWLLGSCLLIAFRTRGAGLAALIFGLAIFALTNLVIRQPFFWFAIALCLVNEGENKLSVADRMRRSWAMSHC
jgi:hypothetical protein